MIITKKGRKQWNNSSQKRSTNEESDIKGLIQEDLKKKYKELNPEKYGDTIQKVISKGSTPAGMHISICVKEILEFFDIQPGQKGLDATLGYGGHTKKMLERLQGKGQSTH